MCVICNDIGCSAKMLTYFSLIGRPHFYIDTTLVDFSMSRFFLQDVTQMYQFFLRHGGVIFSAYTTTCRNQYVFSGKYKKKELVHLPISTALTTKCKKEGRNIVFLLRKGIRTDPDISTCKTPVAAFQQLLTSKDFDSAPRAHYPVCTPKKTSS